LEVGELVVDAAGVLWWDFDGTLVSRPDMWAEVALRLLDRHAPGHDVSAETMSRLVASGMPWHRADHAHPDLSTPSAWWDAVNRRYVEVFEGLGHGSAASAGTLAVLRDDILDVSRYRVFDDVLPSLERASSAGWRNVIVSNHIPELRDLVSGLGLTRHFEAIVSSGVVGYEKPHRRLFDEALRYVRPGEEVWMIGDNCDADCRPVSALGMKAVLVRGAASSLFEAEAADLIGALDRIGVSGQRA
jgi:putative hydrolase of the HAD superfamily